MKKITVIEIFVVFIVILGFAFYFIPKIMISAEQKQYTRLQTNSAMATSKILAAFSDNISSETPETIVEKVCSEMNTLVKNPINKKNPAYSVREECLGCVVMIPDNKVKNVVLTAKDKEGKLVTRTVIQPPSYVRYDKDFNEK